MPLAEGERPDGGEALQCPVEQQGVEVGVAGGLHGGGGPAGPAVAGPPGPRGTSQRSSWSSATRWPRRSSRAGTVTGPAESWRSESTWGTASTASATAPASMPAGAAWTSDQASKSATQPRRTAESSRSQARSRQPGRAVSPCSSISPASRARSHPARTCAGESSRAAAARSRAWAASGAVAPGPGASAAQWAMRTASARTALAWRASSARGGVPSGGRGAGLVRRVVTALRAVARGRGRTSRSLESRGVRDVTGAVLPLTARKPKRKAFRRYVKGSPGATTRGEFTPSAHMRGVRKRRRVSS